MAGTGSKPRAHSTMGYQKGCQGYAVQCGESAAAKIVAGTLFISGSWECMVGMAQAHGVVVMGVGGVFMGYVA